ncbi:hypothetical protein A2U01_0068048, partial [Trifolium medium]|nr:hypothetical protein [Trifolium medium]
RNTASETAMALRCGGVEGGERRGGVEGGER